MRVRFMLGVLLLSPLLIWAGMPSRADEKKADTKNNPKPAVAKAYEVPFRMTGTKHVMVRAKLNGKGPYHFIVDSGAPTVFLATTVAKEVGLTPDDKHWAKCDTLAVEGGPALADVKVRVEDMFQLEGMNGLGMAGVKLHGVLGYSLLAKFRLEFDFTRDAMTWTELDYEPTPFKAVGGKGSGLEWVGQLAKGLGSTLGKGIPEPKYRGFLGAELKDGEDGVEVKAVLADGPAAKAGLEAGDRITHVQGAKVRSLADIHRRTTTLTTGDKAQLTIHRGTSAKELAVTFGEGL